MLAFIQNITDTDLLRLLAATRAKHPDLILENKVLANLEH
jgi:hypothetical protein